ncbi:MAG: hypothetical protein P8J20_01535, partial [Novosphingobium sp.]|nr:hypothetical protein [Novosphingobium sp.]
PKTAAPAQYRAGICLTHVPVEQPVLIGSGGNDTSGMTARHVLDQFSEQLQTDQHRLQRVVPQFPGAIEQIIEKLVFHLDMALNQRMGERVFIPKMLEEPTLGDFSTRHDLVDGGCVEPFQQHRFLRDIHDPPAGFITARHHISPENWTTGTVP